MLVISFLQTIFKLYVSYIYICYFITFTGLLILRVDVSPLTRALELRIGNTFITRMPLQMFWDFPTLRELKWR